MVAQRTKVTWPPFVDAGTTYDLSHLDEFTLKVQDSSKIERGIVVQFSDHCFTRDGEGPTDIAPTYPGCSRGHDGRFCAIRYVMSLGLKQLVTDATGGQVWNTDGDNYAVVKATFGGVEQEYAVVFSLDPIKGIQDINLHMRIRTAHPRNQGPIETFGSVRFSHLVKLRIEGKRPPKLYDAKRKRPK